MSEGVRVATFAFLSEAWIDEARKIRAEYRGRALQAPVAIRMNQIITDVPFGSGEIEAHLDTSAGELELEAGHLDHPDVTITVDYTTAKAILIDGDAQAAMQAFLGGRIKVDGDITKLLALQTSGVIGSSDPLAAEAARRIQEITE
jgi:hypothetical protein